MKNLLYIIGIIILMCISAAIGYNYAPKIESVTVKTDTLFDTLKIIEPKYITKRIIRTDTDTLYSVDSVKIPVQIPITQQTYSDTSYKAYVSGYRCKLDSIFIYNKTIEKTEINTVKSHPRFSVTVGVGYGATKTGLSPVFSIGVGYTLFSW